jgi:diadenosine tetraphosphatase ApaH/serine/threonine PP2A family protein phosphatase
MPYLIVSDVHGNLEALQAVLQDAAGRYEKILCLGDLVGYGADPNAICEWARASVAAIVRGNHDKACCGNEALDDYRPVAAASVTWTHKHLTPENLAYLERLPRGPLRYEDFDLAHGSPLDEDEYLITEEDAAPVIESLEARVTFIGHTHVQGGFLLARKKAARISPDRTLPIEPEYLYLINPGSVGQPRDSDPRAAYALYSPADRVVEYFRVAYDIDAAAAKIRAAGLPEPLASRLSLGR